MEFTHPDFSACSGYLLTYAKYNNDFESIFYNLYNSFTCQYYPTVPVSIGPIVLTSVFLIRTSGIFEIVNIFFSYFPYSFICRTNLSRDFENIRVLFKCNNG